MSESNYAAREPRRSARIISYAWGESYVDELLSFVLPALLAPGNLPYFASQVPCELTLVTEERFFPKIAAHPIIAKLSQFSPLRLVGLDDLITRRDQYGIALTYVLHRAMADLGPAVTEHWLIFLNADFILADGSLRNLLGHFASGERIIASPSYCVAKEDAIPELKKHLTTDLTELAVPPREMARLILKHRHSTVRAKTVNQLEFHMRYVDQFYWLADDDTLLGHQMPAAIVGMRPERYVKEPNSYWDHGLMLEFCPTAEVKLLGDSDEFLMMELRGRSVAENDLVPGEPKPKELAERMIDWVTPYQASFAKRPLTLHASDLPNNVNEVRKRLAEYVDEVMSHAPRKFPSHLNHPQWDYHWPQFMKTRHAFLAANYDPTPGDSRPQLMYAIDQLWWRLSAIGKSHERKIELMTKAIHEIDRQLEAFPRLLTEKLKAALRDGRTSQTLYPTVTFEQGAGRNSSSELGKISSNLGAMLSTAGGAWAREYHEALKQKAILRDAIASAEWEFTVHEGAEHSNLKHEYDKLIESRVKSAAFPKMRWRVGGGTPGSPAEGTFRGILRSVYYAVFGRWPRVTMLNPFWATFQPLLHAIDVAKSEGAQNLLIVGDHSDIAQRIDDLPGIYGWISIEGLLSGLLGSVMLQDGLLFDLCIVDLDTDDVSRWSEIVGKAKPHMRSGGCIVGFHMNAGHPLTAAAPRLEAGETLQVTGSTAAVRTIAFRARALRPSRLRSLRWARALVGLAFSAVMALRANRAEADAARGKHSVPPELRTSLSIIVPVLPSEDRSGISGQSISS